MLAAVSSDIQLEAFSSVPDSRRQAVIETFSNAPNGIKTIINRLSQEFAVNDTRLYRDKNGNIRMEACHYNPANGMIRMNPKYDDGEYAEVFRHEYGHMVDHKCGNVAVSSDFINAIDNDLAKFKQDPNLKAIMLTDLMSNDAMYDRCVSDILSGNFHNDSEIVDTYKRENLSYYHHENNYWDGIEAPQKARELEMFANLFSVYSAQGRSDSILFLEKYFPSATNEFKSWFGI